MWTLMMITSMWNDVTMKDRMMTPRWSLMMTTMTWLEVATLEEQGLQGRPRRRAMWTPSEDDYDEIIQGWLLVILTRLEDNS